MNRKHSHYTNFSNYDGNVSSSEFSYMSTSADFAKDWHLRLAKNLGGTLGRAKGNISIGNVRQAGREVEDLVRKTPKAVVDEVVESGREARQAVNEVAASIPKKVDEVIQARAKDAGRYVSRTQGSLLGGYVEGTTQQVTNQGRKALKDTAIVTGGLGTTGLAGYGGYKLYSRKNKDDKADFSFKKYTNKVEDFFAKQGLKVEAENLNKELTDRIYEQTKSRGFQSIKDAANNESAYDSTRFRNLRNQGIKKSAKDLAKNTAIGGSLIAGGYYLGRRNENK